MNQSVRLFLRPFLVVLAFTAVGCDNAYKYLFHPPEAVEYTLVPDFDQMSSLADTSYAVTRDSTGIVCSRGSYKIEIAYMTDHHLNNSEFPEDSRDGEFSANPFTYANWIDPQTGVTPNRFSVFKVSIYNYTAPKLNFDPERSFLLTDRGDLYNGYGREEKTSKNFSLEAYFKRRKGASGVEDEIFERRMGIIRTTVLYLGRPIYAGDNREGFVVYDPLHESVERVKLTLKDFILGYDENNEPSEFATFTFFFRRIPLTDKPVVTRVAAIDTSAMIEYRTMEIHQLRYRPQEEEDVAAGTEEWNAQPAALTTLARFLQDSLRIKASLRVSQGDSPELSGANLIALFAGPSDPVITENEVAGIAEAIKRGSTLFIENAAFTTRYAYATRAEQILSVLASKLENARTIQIGPDHPIFRSWKKFTALPEGSDDRENMPERRDYLTGLVWKNRTVAIMSTKGYSMIWGAREPFSSPQYHFGANIVQYALAPTTP